MCGKRLAVLLTIVACILPSLQASAEDAGTAHDGGAAQAGPLGSSGWKEILGGSPFRKEEHAAIAAAAERGLEVLKRLAERDPGSFGFDSLDEVRHAEIAEAPISTRFVDLDGLRQMKPPQTLWQIASPRADHAMMLFPVSVPGLAGGTPSRAHLVRSSVGVAKMDGGWKAISYGSAERIKYWTSLRASWKGRPRDPGTFVVLAIQGLGVDLLSTQDDDEYLLISDPSRGTAALLKRKDGTQFVTNDELQRVLPPRADVAFVYLRAVVK